MAIWRRREIKTFGYLGSDVNNTREGWRNQPLDQRISG